MTLVLAPHLHLAVLGDDVVLLDVAADAYVCIPDGRAQLRPSPDRRRVSPPEPAAREALRAAGWVLAAGPAAEPRLCVRPRHDVGGPGTETLRLREALRLAGALWDLVRRYRGRPFGEILAFVARDACLRTEVAERAEILRLARLFQRWAVWLPMPRKCLARSFVLLRFLQRSGLGASWVFGVSTWPFAAHCWLQLEDIALDDAWDRLAAYEPILAVG